MKKYAKKELNRLAVLSENLGYFNRDGIGRYREFVCPVHYEAIQKTDRPRVRAHLFTVMQPRERNACDSLLRKDLIEALVQHLTVMVDDNTPCYDLRRAVKR